MRKRQSAGMRFDVFFSVPAAKNRNNRSFELVFWRRKIFLSREQEKTEKKLEKTEKKGLAIICYF